MDFPSRLESLLEESETLLEQHAIDLGVKSPSVSLEQWNEDIEAFLGDPSASSIASAELVSDEKTFAKQLCFVSCLLMRNILKCCDESGSSALPSISKEVVCNDAIETKMTNVAQGIQDNSLQYAERLSNEELPTQLIRAGKNFLRWFIQIYLDRPQQSLQASHDSPIRVLQTPSMLGLIFGILKWSSLNPTRDINRGLARYASLYLFYGTYITNPQDVVAQQGIHHLIHDLSFPKVALELLCHPTDVPTALSLVRNLHNMAVSLPDATKIILDTQTTVTAVDTTAPWLTTMDSNKPVSFVSLGESIVCWYLQQRDDTLNDGVADDKASELVLEILTSFYALGVGRQLKEPEAKNDLSDETNTLISIVTEILKLPSQDQGNITITVNLQFQIAIFSLMMDSDSSFGQYLMDHDHTAFEGLLQVLNHQVHNVVDQSRVDSSATASLIPILVTSTKYAGESAAVQMRIKKFIFPPDRETLFEQKIQDLVSSASNTNMSPLDAPKNTLRGELVQLLSWPESYIKRCTAEFLWILFNRNANEYVHRVGMGNALPLLHAKGLAAMPTSNIPFTLPS
ncbi:guanine nucleotide exchange factor synembryn [Nitzschia inconspicua]|uniref:Guanine nucleotide exchange factor synembryn n=1 Tax=Nitzschia inconspicua TaxID=303405 RepID=A0A9K3KQU1_9STRA|nr:guanine nucleotide exchange factor synembryn [Nitzschia inconspicua]